VAGGPGGWVGGIPVPAPTPATILKKLLAAAILLDWGWFLWLHRRSEAVDMHLKCCGIWRVINRIQVYVVLHY
jgi:hypothetical protein